ncbi:hypothetical protein ACFYS7_08390 [Streptomyces avermitilis]|uniref:hypothetical protein n=1 Tax=Streptomyces avermitilis TaxID=33903 RepID=UPI0033B1D6D6
MRFQRAVISGPVALVALALLTGCGSDDKTKAADPGLPSAAGMASVESFVTQHASCQHPRTGPAYDANHEGENDSWGVEEAADPSWGIKERSVCTDESGHPVTLLTVPDMKKFQTAAKKNGERFLVGRNFSVVPVGDATGQELTKSGLRFLTCDPGFTPPSGSRKEPGLVDGCVLSDHFPTD